MAIYEKAKPLGGISLNYEVVGGTTSPTTFKKENTIWVNTSTAIGEHYFSFEQPADYLNTTEYYIFGGSTASSNYTEGWTNGNASSISDSQITCGTDAWIRTTSKIDVTNINTITAYLYIQQSYESEIYIALGDSYGYKYTGIKHYMLSVSSGSATNGIYKTITLDVGDLTGSYYMCLSHRGFGSSYWQWIKGDKTIDNTPAGTVWIQTDIDKAPIGFNTIKRNELMVYPYKLKQWGGSNWSLLEGILYHNGIAMQNYDNTVEFYPGRTVELVSNYGGSYDLNNFSVYLSSTTRGQNSPSLAIPVDVTGLNKLTINGNFNITNGKGYLGIFLYPSKNTTGSHNTIGDQLDPSHYTLMDRIVCNANGTSSSATSFVFDVSTLTGVYYLHMTGYANRDSSKTAVVINGDINTVIGE